MRYVLVTLSTVPRHAESSFLDHRGKAITFEKPPERVVTIGRYDLSVRDVAYILIDNVHPLVTPYWDPVQEVVVEQVRLPRIMEVCGTNIAAPSDNCRRTSISPW